MQTCSLCVATWKAHGLLTEQVSTARAAGLAQAIWNPLCIAGWPPSPCGMIPVDRLVFAVDGTSWLANGVFAGIIE